MMKKGPALLAFLLFGHGVYAQDRSIEAYVTCTANTVVARTLEAQCLNRGWVLFPPSCQAEMKTLFDALGQAAVNRAQALGQANANERLQGLAGMDPCDAFESVSSKTQPVD